MSFVAVAVFLAFRFTPWPSVAVIQLAFSRGGQASAAALAEHVPDNIVTKLDLAYSEGADAVFDINYTEGAKVPRPTIIWVQRGGGSRAARPTSPII